MNANEIKKPKVFIMDVDGILTDGSFYYTIEGKVMKKFGADDNDALSLLKPYINIIFVTGDKKGFPISKKRIVDDMHMKLELVSTIKRIDWIKQYYDPEEVIYMGDGIFDHYVMREVGYSISVSNGDNNAKMYADYVTQRNGGSRAVAEACMHILEKFFEKFDPEKLPTEKINVRRDWTV
ncbi:3-deoxy-D-manno-octulosonate 8-phosphate phosphatase (KDO 8-P phosphatase) [Clostridium saccharoperbutylacetonicum]|nr:HAD hydrolase family protein [Clostridium saccharoperbutylacetonicum]NRT60921.1 3-deoxy-D-manno-octulosonate 8-phosphate phosphatase (KDO 8-P phosphatase) [Clostridium saccharoperbutylacetonicum]NSB24234.1 3-deoxy-D-manno-octulosonate 8-phosphate phosphatase (KDO 8-P phosphatase) [Clostridium saccharoperbutylacetonicum]NSB43612.1 3-deoxy-D-manno-octulosonate 8-phosphate phosphatase (KDO 8-P phosphatase) [Clostridium saccharoperbutylacetonicum]